MAGRSGPIARAFGTGVRRPEAVWHVPHSHHRRFLTWGVGLDVEETIPKLLEARLNARSKTRRFEVINAAIPGYNTLQEMRLLKKRGLKYKPDMVLLIFNLTMLTTPQRDRDTNRAKRSTAPDPGRPITVAPDAGESIRSTGLRGMVSRTS